MAERPQIVSTKNSEKWDAFFFSPGLPKIPNRSETKTGYDSYLALFVYGSVYRWSISITVQRDATQSSLFIILQVHSTCFGCQPHPSSGAHKTVTTASATVQLPPSNVATLSVAVVTVLCTPDDGCGWHPKHVEWICRIINRLLCVASRRTIINIKFSRFLRNIGSHQPLTEMSTRSISWG